MVGCRQCYLHQDYFTCKLYGDSQFRIGKGNKHTKSKVIEKASIRFKVNGKYRWLTSGSETITFMLNHNFYPLI